jgi:hypothetical protein
MPNNPLARRAKDPGSGVVVTGVATNPIVLSLASVKKPTI